MHANKALAANREREAVETQLRVKQEKEREEERRKLEAEARLKQEADPQAAPEPAAADVAAPQRADGTPSDVAKQETPPNTSDAGAGVAARAELRKTETVVRKPLRPVADEVVADDDDLRGKKKAASKSSRARQGPGGSARARQAHDQQLRPRSAGTVPCFAATQARARRKARHGHASVAREDHARGDDPRGHHHPGTRQPHDRASRSTSSSS